MNILHIDCSPRAGSHSRELSQAIVEHLLENLTDRNVVRRDLGREPIPHTDSAYAEALSSPANFASGIANGVMNLSEILINEIETADAVVIGTPINNFTVPSVLKAWIDQVLRVGRTIGVSAAGDKFGLLEDKPIYIAIASGGVFMGERAKQPDFLTPYLKAAFGCVGINSLHFFPLQATAFLNQDQLRIEQETLLSSINANHERLEV
jgi:FMN-dependent NADH-azoreductase